MTALVYKNQRIVRKNNPSEHPLFLGHILLRKEATFEAYHLFFSSIKAKLCKENSVRAVEIRMGKDVVFGSDEVQALTEAIKSVFPSSIRLLCLQHIKNNLSAYMTEKAGVPQKDRVKITKAIFDEDDDESGDRANNSAIFDEKVAKNSETFVVLYMGKVIITWSND